MIDIIIPTCKSYHEVAEQVREMIVTSGVVFRIAPTCRDASSAFNRNVGLEGAESDIVIMVDDDIECFPQGWAQ